MFPINIPVLRAANNSVLAALLILVLIFSQILKAGDKTKENGSKRAFNTQNTQVEKARKLAQVKPNWAKFSADRFTTLPMSETEKNQLLKDAYQETEIFLSNLGPNLEDAPQVTDLFASYQLCYLVQKIDKYGEFCVLLKEVSQKYPVISESAFARFSDIGKRNRVRGLIFGERVPGNRGDG